MRVLVIEDEHKIANFIKTGLGLETWSADIAYDGEEALDLVSSEKYDVIILDLMLPKLSGIEFCRILRHDLKIHTPVLVLTAKGAVEDKIEGLNTGADDYLVKPFVFAELVARVRALSRRPEYQNSTALNIDDLTLDPIKLEVIRGNKKILLSKKEFALLEYLLKNKNIVKSKDEIIQSIWNYDDDILPNTVEVYINYLREKIDKPFSNSRRLINTVRGFGYTISDE